MNRSEKMTLTNVNKIPIFKEVIKKLTINIPLNNEEKVYILGCAIIFLKSYDRDKRFTSYAEFAYYIILKYSIFYGDYVPLYDFSANFGFYPITKSILDNKLLTSENIIDCCLNINLDSFKFEMYIETIHQYVEKKKLLQDQANEMSYIAPTSFGKSSVIIDYIKKYSGLVAKIGIVVPTKSLLMQTYRMIREGNLNRKIIIHDEMYQGEESFIAIFTQERALRLLNKHQVYFDLLFIDEAHNILKDDQRSILLSRLLSKNRLLNLQQKVIYLSPLIDDTSNLKIADNQVIHEHKIPFNIKEPEIYEYKLNQEVCKYNRFVGVHYKLGTYHNMFDYIIKSSSNKNFVYNYKPVSIEQFAKVLSAYIKVSDTSNNIKELVRILKQEVHEKFYAVDYIEHGIIYLHGKLPDLIKEYLESKFRDLLEIKYVIANSVILEGMNLPIDNLYILNTRSLYGKELTNLIGRVNRLNTIFTSSGNNLGKLLPNVHFINSSEYNRNESNMTNKIELLRSRVFKDVVENPTMNAYDFEKLGHNKDQKAKAKLKCEQIQQNEAFLNKLPADNKGRLRQYLIENGIAEFYGSLDKLTDILEVRISNIANRQDWAGLDMMNKINDLFILNLDFITDFEFSRLLYLEARKYYDFHITVSQKKALKENVNHMYEHFKKRVAQNDGKTYFGETYGEEARDDNENQFERKTYINLALKSDVELINLAIVKLKMEDDFVSFKLNKFIIMMYDFGLITLNDYNRYIYGTTDQNKINLTKIGLSVSLISRLEEDDQLKYLYFDTYNNLKSSTEFEAYKLSANDFYRFEIERFLN